MRLTLGAAPSDVAVIVSTDPGMSPGPVFDPNTMYSTGTVGCPPGLTFDTKTGQCVGAPAHALICPVGVDVTGYGDAGGCVCPSGYALDPSTNQCKAAGAAGVSTSTWLLLGGIAAAFVLLAAMAGGRR